MTYTRLDARLVWDTWRRLLSDDDLVQWVLDAGSRESARLHLGGEEMAILADYAETPAATSTNVGMYRRGLVRNALGALDQVPLTRHLLRAGELDEETVAEQFAASTGYRDYGPLFWGAAADFVDFLAGLPLFASGPHQDVLALDRETIGLALRLGTAHDMEWPDPGHADNATEPDRTGAQPVRFVRSPAATTVSTSCDISAWIENPFDFNPGDRPPLAPQHFLVYFSSADAPPEYAIVSERAARAFQALSTPLSTSELSALMHGLSPADARVVVGELAALGVVVPHAVMFAAARS